MSNAPFADGHVAGAFTPLFAAAPEFSARIGTSAHAFLLMRVIDEKQVTANVAKNPVSGGYEIEVSGALLEWIERAASVFSDTVFAHSSETDENAGLKIYLQQSWLLAILCHEFAHIGAGHVNYLNARPGSSLKAVDEVKVRRIGVGPDRVPLRFFEYEADFGAGLWLVDFATNPPVPLSRWKSGTPQQNLIVALAGFALFTFRLEKQVRNGEPVSQNYPSPLLRFNIVTSSMLSDWEERFPDERFSETIMKPVIEMLWSVRDRFPEVEFVRSFADSNWMDDLERQVSELASETSTYGDFIKPFRLSSFFD